MSSINTGRIKQIRKRTGTKQYSSVPIGTNGILVDMLSELDLEEEIKLGGNHYVDIIQTDTATEIREWYFSEPRGTRTITEMSQYVTYSALVRIISAVDINIIFPQPGKDISEDGDPFAVTGYNEQYYPYLPDGAFIVSRQAIPFNEERIEMSLYRYDMDNGGTLLHSKIIYIYEDPLTDRVVIDEQMDNNEDTNNPLTLEEENIEPEQGEQEGGNEP